MWRASWGLQSRLQPLTRNGSPTGAGRWDSAPLGSAQLWHQNPGTPYQTAGVRRCACHRMGAMAAPLERAISQGRAASSGRAPWGPNRRGSGLNPFWWMAIASACLLSSEARRRNAHPAPIGAPALSPQSPSCALLQQHLGLASSALRKN